MNLITTMASGWYRAFIPLFEYTAKKYNPDCDVKVYTREEVFPSYPDSATSALRFLMPDKYYEGYDYIYITDVDFVFLKHDPDMFQYHINSMIKTGLPYSAYRGRTHKGKKIVWDGDKTRIAAGVLVVTPQWIKKTSKVREKIRDKIKSGLRIRVQDEILLYRICRDSGIRTPRIRRCLPSGVLFDKNYRNLHLGDFRDAFAKKRWMRIKRMGAWFFSNRSVKKYRKLCKDNKYMALVTEARKNAKIDELFHNLDWHLNRR
jgi:hypothetical protein